VTVIDEGSARVKDLVESPEIIDLRLRLIWGLVILAAMLVTGAVVLEGRSRGRGAEQALEAESSVGHDGSLAALDEATPEGELLEVRRILEQSVRGLDELESLERVLVDFTTIRASLGLFELRFGVQPDEVEAWSEIEESAKSLLAEFKRRSEKGLYFNRDSARMAYCVLLELGGQREEALDELKAIVPGGDCGNWHATVEMSAARQKSGLYQRMGRYVEALSEQKKADEWERNRLIPALGILGDRRAIPVLRQIAKSSNQDAKCIHALASLHKLGDDSRIVLYLKRVKSSREFSSRSWLDDAIREIKGGGPELSGGEEHNNQAFAQAWLRWLEENESSGQGGGTQ